MRSFKSPTRVVVSFLLHFFIFLSTRQSVQNSSLLEHHKTRSRESERERRPFSLPGDVVNDDEQRLFLLTLLALLFSVSRERIVNSNGWRRTADASPQRWSGSFTHSRDDDDWNRWGRGPVRAPFRHRAHFTVRFFCSLPSFMYSNKRDETMRSSPFWIRLNSNCCRFLTRTRLSLSLS